jgi:hypothetical protein
MPCRPWENGFDLAEQANPARQTGKQCMGLASHNKSVAENSDENDEDDGDFGDQQYSPNAVLQLSRGIKSYQRRQL